MASAKPWIISVTSPPIMWAPISAPVVASNTVLTKPSVSPAAIALPLARNGKRPTLTSRPLALACASVRPTEAICGVE